MRRLIFGVLLILFLLLGCGDNGPAARCDTNKFYLVEDKVPVHPDTDPAQIAGFEMLRGKRGRAGNYITRATSQQVLDFYEDFMIKGGWSSDTWGDPAPNIRWYMVPNCCWYWWLEVKTEPVDTTLKENGPTKVTIEYWQDQGCG